ncbi:hypothetical protein ACGFNV_45515 [Streptomyces sp. NPDC048751]|uniref:hypothetical protein n=1 Tax=Streptomyces sp. NPDC048751 TaxID=3365591 RepID=UPI00371F36C9
MAADQPAPAAHGQVITNPTRLTHNSCHQRAHSHQALREVGARPADQGCGSG